MGNEEYNNKLETLKAIDESQVQKPHHVPVAVYIDEAELLFYWAQQDKAELVAAGLTWELVEDIPNRTWVLSIAEADLQSLRRTGPESQQELNNRFPAAEELMKKLINDFRFAFREHPLLMKTLGGLLGGKSRAFTIQCLFDLSQLGKANPELLAAIDFDFSLLDKAERTSDEMPDLVAMANTDRLKPNEAADIRNRAYTHLKEAVDAVRDYGKYVFRQNKERFVGYRSSRRRQERLRQSRKAKEKAAAKCNDE